MGDVLGLAFEFARLDAQLDLAAGVLLSVVALGYYLRVIVTMYMRSPVEEAPVADLRPWPSMLAVTACAAIVLGLGVLPGWLLDRL